MTEFPPKTDDISDIDALLRHPFPRWLTCNAAAVYVGMRPSTFRHKLEKGLGPKFYRSPHTIHRLFFSDDLSSWVRDTPQRSRSPLEIERGRMLHEIGPRGTAARRAGALERRRARLAQEAPPAPDEIEKLEPAKPRAKPRQRATKVTETA